MSDSNGRPRSGHLRPLGVILVALAALLSVCSSALADANDAASRARTPKNLYVQAYTGPFRYIAGATVTVTDPATGRTMATAKTLRHGEVRLRVAGAPSRTAPFVVTVTGGRVRGRAFVGTLTTILPEVGPAAVQRVDLSTTAAAKMPLARTGGFAKNLASARRALGFVGRDKDQQLRFYSYAVGDRQLLRAVTKAGGYDAFTTMLARTARTGGRVKGLRTRVLQLPHREYYRAYKQRTRPKHKKPAKSSTARSAAPTTRQSSSSSTSTTMSGAAGAPCASTFAPPANAGSSQNTALIASDFAIESGIGLITLAASSNPLQGTPAIAAGVTGFALTEVNNALDPSTGETETTKQLNAISDQLNCISNQILALQSSVDVLTEAVANSTAASCESAINNYWVNMYEPAITLAADNPSDASDQLNSSNYLLGELMGTSTTESLIFTNLIGSPCSQGAINQMLFAGIPGVPAGWSTLVANYEAGDFVSTDKVALAPSSVQGLQMYLQSWSTLEYQMFVLINEYYNYQINELGQSAQNAQQQAMLGNTTGASCATAPAVTNVNTTANNACQVLQNIVDVYPSDTYSDEVALWSATSSTCAAGGNSLCGLAVSAIPGGLGNYGSGTALPSPVTSITQQTPSALGGMCANTNSFLWPCTQGWGASTWNQAVTSYNTIPTGTLAPPYELWSAPQVDKTGVLCTTCGYQMSLLSGFFNSQLNATAGSVASTVVTGDDSTSTTSTSTSTVTQTTVNGAIAGSTSSPAWQLVGSGSTLANYDTAGNAASNTSLWAYGCQVVAQGTFYTPSPWVLGDGYTITPYTSPVNNEDPSNTPYIGMASFNECTGSMFPTSPSVAVLATRPWTQSTAWPAAPVITSTTINNTGATSYQLTANYCPASGCSWSYSGTLPSGWSISSTGVLTVPSSSVTSGGSLTVIAGNNYAFGYATVTLPQLVAPVVTSTSVTGYYQGTNAVLKASSCGSTCTWKSSSGTQYVTVQSNGTVVCGINTAVGEWSGTISVTATNAVGTSAPTNVTVTCYIQSVSPYYGPY